MLRRSEVKNNIPRSTLMVVSDNYDPSVEDLVTWQDRMIAAGKMYRPNVTSIERVTADGFSFSLNDMVCGVFVGGQANYKDNQHYLCETMRNLQSHTNRAMQIITQDELCEGNRACTAFTSISLQLAGWFVDGKIANHCGQIFNEMYENCHGAVGGSANITVRKGDAHTTGVITNQFYDDDPGATCPKNGLKNQYCKVRRP